MRRWRRDTETVLLPAELKGMVSPASTHRGKDCGNDEKFHGYLFSNEL